MVGAGPCLAATTWVRWRLIDVCQWVWDEFRLSVSRQTLGRELRAMHCRKLSAPAPSRPGGRGDRTLQRSLPALLDAIARAVGVALHDLGTWFGDQARIGQKNKVTRRWGKRGTRPVAPRDQRTASTYIFGAICPKEGKAAGLVLPRCSTEAMALHLAAISAELGPGRHAALLVDRAGWHTSAKLTVAANITRVAHPRALAREMS